MLRQTCRAYSSQFRQHASKEAAQHVIDIIKRANGKFRLSQSGHEVPPEKLNSLLPAFIEFVTPEMIEAGAAFSARPPQSSSIRPDLKFPYEERADVIANRKLLSTGLQELQVSIPICFEFLPNKTGAFRAFRNLQNLS